jgi:hypothetical protein
MTPQQRKTLGDAIFFIGGPVFCLLVIGVEAAAGYGWAILMAILARTIID